MGTSPQGPLPPGPPIPPPSLPPPPAPDRLAEALRFHEVAIRQITECRASFEMYYRITLAAVGVVIVGFLTLFYFMFGHEYSSLQERADRDFDQLSQKLQKNIEQRANDAFSTPAMQATIHKAAVEQVKAAVTAGVSKELSTIRQEADSAGQQAASTRSDVNKYLIPRVLTDKQRADLKRYLSSHAGFGPILFGTFGEILVIKYVINNPEAEAYALQLRDAFRDAGWKSDILGDLPPRFTAPLSPGLAVGRRAPL